MKRTDPIRLDKVIETDHVMFVGHIGVIHALRRFMQGKSILEPSSDEQGLQGSPDPDTDSVVPGAYIPLDTYSQVVRDLHDAGYRLIRIEPEPE